MKNKVPFIVLAILLLMDYKPVLAQTEQQSVMLGGTAGISYTSQKPTHVFSMNFNPNFGYFVYHNLLLGFGLSLGVSSDNSSKDGKNRFSVSSSFVPQARYYFLKEKLRPFVYARFGYQSTTTIHNGDISNKDGMTGEGGVGLDYFLTKNVALESTLGYNGTKLRSQNLISKFAFSLGLQYYFHPRIKQEDLPK